MVARGSPSGVDSQGIVLGYGRVDYYANNHHYLTEIKKLAYSLRQLLSAFRLSLLIHTELRLLDLPDNYRVIAGDICALLGRVGSSALETRM